MVPSGSLAARPVRGGRAALRMEDGMSQLETMHTALGERRLDRLRTVIAVALVGIALITGAVAWMP
jgi:hypothetical protein